ncbi:AAA family ATPase [Taibaiella lutea]|uniref:phosphoribulokinase n=1 Tax=Taibaiella lutea TaxID=2608001 RepID=A0A5M6CID8_9BACT|nr:AAA family ATPase [Taibaiella lutea]KAA5534874.1 AAA family ATPase [Taibaiella lutea]
MSVIIEQILDEVKYKLSSENQVLFISICGCADTGKSTFAKVIAEVLSAMSITCNFLSTDSFMLERQERNKLGISGYNPQSLNIDALLNVLALLRKNQTYRYYAYDNKTGRNSDEGIVMRPSKVYIIEGIHAFNQQIRQHTSFGIFIHAEDEILRKMRLRANVSKRGFDEETAGEKIASEMMEFNAYVLPDRHYANLIINVDEHYSYRIA